MYRLIQPSLRVIAATLALCAAASSTIVQRLSFEELTDSSDIVVAGAITRSWAAWDSDHKYIWTHYQLSVTSAPKGAAARTVEFAEPGGALDGVVHAITGAVSYQPGENVLVFLQRMPNGYLRTTGWGQGKYGLDAAGKLRGGSALRSVELTNGARQSAGASLQSLEGMTLREVSQHIGARQGRVQ